MGRQEGFTLIELMIVIAILAILSTMAMPSYQDRVIRAQVAEGMALAGFAQRAVEQHRESRGGLPADNIAAGLPPPDQIVGNYVDAVAVEGGAVTITYGNRVNRNVRGMKLSLRPAVVEKHSAVPIAWVCGLASAPERMAVRGANATTLSAQQLPVDCR